MHTIVVMGTVNWVWCLYPVYLEESVISGKLRFEIVCNSHFSNYSIHRSVVMATVNWV